MAISHQQRLWFLLVSTNSQSQTAAIKQAALMRRSPWEDTPLHSQRALCFAKESQGGEGNNTLFRSVARQRTAFTVWPQSRPGDLEITRPGKGVSAQRLRERYRRSTRDHRGLGKGASADCGSGYYIVAITVAHIDLPENLTRVVVRSPF